MSLRKGLIVFVLLAFAANSVIIAKSVDAETLRSLLHADKLALLGALGVVFFTWLCDAGRFCALSHAAQERVSLPMGLVLTWLNYFGSAVTPMQSGGGPFQVYVLYKKGVAIGKGIAITLVRTMLTVLILSVVVPTVLVLDPAILQRSPFLKGIVSYVFVVILATWVFIAFTIARPEAFKRLAKALILWGRRLKLLRSQRTIIRSFQWLDREMDNYLLNFKLLFQSRSGRLYLLLAAILSVIHLLALFTVLPILMHAVGLPFRYSEAVAIQAVFMFILYFVPTPGASGVAEGGGALLFGMLMPWNMAGIMAIIWRFFTEYLSIFMGVVVVVRMLGWGVSEDLHQGAAPEEEALKDKRAKGPRP